MLRWLKNDVIIRNPGVLININSKANGNYKIASDWAKAEVLSSKFFILFGIIFIAAAIGFWQLGKTEIARAYIIPTLVAGAFLSTVGFGLFFTNKSRISSFEVAYSANSEEFIKTEIVRSEKTINEYKMIVFRVIPLIIVVAALLIVFIDSPLWRAIGITTIAMMVVILLVDSNANARMEDYKELLEQHSNK